MSKIATLTKGQYFIYLFMLMLFFALQQNSHASYVIYSNPYTVSSVPVDSEGFYYSDSRGNSVSIRQSTNVPVIFNQYTNGQWISQANGVVPSSAIAIQYINGYPVFACRILNHQRVYYGQLVPNQGCFIPGMSAYPFRSYQILVR